MIIYKYTLQTVHKQAITMPKGAKILSVQMQGLFRRLWVLCDPEAVEVSRIIAMYGTGDPQLPVEGEYISTFQVDNGAFVFHLFDLGEEQ